MRRWNVKPNHQLADDNCLSENAEQPRPVGQGLSPSLNSSNAAVHPALPAAPPTTPERLCSSRVMNPYPPSGSLNTPLSAVGRQPNSSLRSLVGGILLVLLIGACTSSTPAEATFTPPAVQPKILVTVAISPTPNAEQQQALAAANPPTATAVVVPTVTATPYIGVFLGEVETIGDGGAVIAPALLGAPTSSVAATSVAGPVCPAQADAMFGTRWAENVEASVALGCPIESGKAYTGTYQLFERGVMYFIPTGEIWAIAPAESRMWYAPNAPPVQPGDIIVPEGMMAPSLGFGAVWRGLPGVQDSLGFARTGEQGSNLVMQKFQNGSLLADGSSGQVFILLSDGRAFGPY